MEGKYGEAREVSSSSLHSSSISFMLLTQQLIKPRNSSSYLLQTLSLSNNSILTSSSIKAPCSIDAFFILILKLGNQGAFFIFIIPKKLIFPIPFSNSNSNSKAVAKNYKLRWGFFQHDLTIIYQPLCQRTSPAMCYEATNRRMFQNQLLLYPSTMNNTFFLNLFFKPYWKSIFGGLRIAKNG
jgi:hypothetical protein